MFSKSCCLDEGGRESLITRESALEYRNHLKCIVFLDETYSKTAPKRLNLGFIGGT